MSYSWRLNIHCSAQINIYRIAYPERERDCFQGKSTGIHGFFLLNSQDAAGPMAIKVDHSFTGRHEFRAIFLAQQLFATVGRVGTWRQSSPWKRRDGHWRDLFCGKYNHAYPASFFKPKLVGISMAADFFLFFSVWGTFPCYLLHFGAKTCTLLNFGAKMCHLHCSSIFPWL